MEENEYMNLSAITAEYRINRLKVRKWITDGTLTAYQSKRNLRERLVLRGDVERLLQLEKIEPVTKAEMPAITPIPTTMGASLEGDAPSLKELNRRDVDQLSNTEADRLLSAYEEDRHGFDLPAWKQDVLHTRLKRPPPQ